MKRFALLSLALGLSWSWSAPAAPAETAPLGENAKSAAMALPQEVAAAVQARIVEGRHPGMIIALVDASGVRYFPFGVTTLGGHRAPDEHTRYEIGSVTKLFTALLLADMVEKHELSLDTGIDSLLPKGVSAPNYVGRQITLAELATHSSGLPREQGDFEPKDPARPHADYTPQVLYAFLSRYTLDRSPGERYLYSNLGFGLLGQLLSLRAGQSYEELVASRITRVLGMQETGVNVPSAQRNRLAQPTANGFPGASSELGALAPAGALRSTAHDLARWVAAQLHPTGPLAQAMTSTQSPRRAAEPGRDAEEPSAGGRQHQIGLAWQLLPVGDDEIVWHNGGTGGYRSFVGFRRGTDRGVVILTNSRFSVDDIGFHLLDPESPLQTWTLFANASLARGTPVHASSERVKQGTKALGSWDFSAGAELWGVRPAPDTREVGSRVRDGSLCASLRNADNAFVTWPDPGFAISSDGFALAQGTRYRLSFRARASGPVRLFAAVGHVSPPYTHAVEASVPVRSGQRWFSVDFEPQQADERAGIGFWASASPLSRSSELCIDDVVLSALD